MSDEQMDARLRSAGERWRTATAVVEQTGDEPLELIPPTPSRPHRTLALVSAAVVVIALAIGAALFAVNRGSDSSPAAATDPTRPLQGVTWTEATSGNTLVFLPGAVRINEWCSSGTYALSVRGESLSVGHLIGTASLCGGVMPSGAQQRANARFDRVVDRGDFTWSRRGSSLRISARGINLTLTTNGARPPGLVDQTWTLEKFNSANGYTHDATVHAKLTFDAAHGFVASDTCNTLNGTSRPTLTTITFGAVKTSLVGCLSPLAVQPVVDRLLHGTTRYEILGDELILSRPHYEGLLVYRAK